MVYVAMNDNRCANDPFQRPRPDTADYKLAGPLPQRGPRGNCCWLAMSDALPSAGNPATDARGALQAATQSQARNPDSLD